MAILSLRREARVAALSAAAAIREEAEALGVALGDAALLGGEVVDCA